MIEKFDLTRLVCMGGNMWIAAFEESQRLRLLIEDNPKNLDYRFKQARFFVSKDDDIQTIIAYCKIIKFFNNNLTAYEELAEYLYFANRNEWAIETCMEGLKFHDSIKLKEIFNHSVACIING